MDFWTDIWPWTWPSLVALGWIAVTLVAVRFLLTGARWHRVSDPQIRKAIKALAGLSILCGLAAWLVMAPLPFARVARGLDATWPWLWPSALLIGLVYLAWVLGRWFMGGLGKQLADSAAMITEGTVVRVTKATVAGAMVAAGVLWAELVPLSAAAHDFIRDSLLPWVLPSLLLIVWIGAGIVATRRLGTWLAARAELTETEFDDLLVEALRRPLWLVVVVAGISLWAGLVPMPAALQEYFDVGAKGATVLLVVMFTNAFVQAWLANKAKTSRVMQTSGTVLRTAAKVIVYVVGILMILSSAGIDVTPVLASLGVGSLAIGLALQKSLEDFLSGLFLAADQPIRAGDFVEVGDAVKGTILKIGWRSTRLRTRDDMYIIVPNSVLAQATLVNRSMPDTEVLFVVPVGISYASDLDRCAEVVRQVASELTAEDPRAVRSFAPRVSYRQFGASSIDFDCWLRAVDWEAHFGLQDAFIRRLHVRFEAEGINIPFPIRTLDIPKGTTLPLRTG